MNGSLSHVHQFQDHFKSALIPYQDKFEIGLCPPFPYLTSFSQAFSSAVCLGGQDCSDASKGAYTGDVSASMLKDVGCSFVVLGHSERRQYHGENAQTLKQKCLQAIEADLGIVLCVGETAAQRQAGVHLEQVATQVRDVLSDMAQPPSLSIAYEPVWAIGTQETPSLEAVGEMVETIQSTYQHLFPQALESVCVLYGGSVNSENVSSFLSLPGLGGVLVGGASLKADTFEALLNACLLMT